MQVRFLSKNGYILLPHHQTLISSKFIKYTHVKSLLRPALESTGIKLWFWRLFMSIKENKMLIQLVSKIMHL